MAGFGQDSKERKSEGIYAPLVGEYVRLVFNHGPAVGKLVYTDNATTHLQPYVVGTGTDLIERVRVVEDKPAIIRTDSIQAILPLGIGREYLDEIVDDAVEKSRQNKIKREKELEKAIKSQE